MLLDKLVGLADSHDPSPMQEQLLKIIHKYRPVSVADNLSSNSAMLKPSNKLSLISKKGIFEVTQPPAGSDYSPVPYVESIEDFSELNQQPRSATIDRSGGYIESDEK